jgi:hypothetical protein
VTLYDWPSGDQAIDDYDYRDHEEDVNQAAANVHHEEAEYPQDKENYRDRPKHDGILARSELHLASRETFLQVSHSRITV